MGGFVSGLGLLILVLVLVFTWLLVATFVSPELASFIGVFVIGFWFVVFVPSGFVRELMWQSRQKKIMKTALEGSPAPYMAGSALPPPSGGGSASGGALVAMDQPSGSAGAVDLYRELPELPKLEPRTHVGILKRSLVLPFVGLCMIWGGTNDLVIYKLLEARGMAQKMPIEHDKIILPDEYSDYQTDMLRAARLTVRREPECAGVMSGKLVAATQFAAADVQKKEIADGNFVYEMLCKGGEKTGGYIAWVAPHELDRGVITTLKKTFAKPPPAPEATKQCTEAVNKALAPRGVKAEPAMRTAENQPPKSALITTTGRMPYPDFLRIHGNYQLLRADGPGGEIEVSCWVGADSPAAVRLRKPSAPPANQAAPTPPPPPILPNP